MGGVEWEAIGDEAKQLIASMLLKDPKVRPLAAQVYEHPWVKVTAYLVWWLWFSCGYGVVVVIVVVVVVVW